MTGHHLYSTTPDVLPAKSTCLSREAPAFRRNDMSYTDLQEKFRRDGVVHIPGAFSTGELARLEEFWQFCIDHPGPVATRFYADRMDRASGLDAARVLPDSGEPGLAYQDVGNPANRTRLEEIIHLPGIESIVAATFGAQSAECLSEQIFLKEPHSPRTSWHQDISDARVEGINTLTLWLSLDPVSAEESLELVRGSHLGPVYDSVYSPSGSAPIPDIECHRDDYDIVSFACQPGDAVLFHFGTLHGGGQTGAASTRRSLALRFIGPDCRELIPGNPGGGPPVKRNSLPVFSA